MDKELKSATVQIVDKLCCSVTTSDISFVIQIIKFLLKRYKEPSHKNFN